MLVIEAKCSKMQKPLQDHIKWIFAAQKIIRAILLLFLSFLALGWYLTKHLLLFRFHPCTCNGGDNC